MLKSSNGNVDRIHDAAKEGLVVVNVSLNLLWKVPPLRRDYE